MDAEFNKIKIKSLSGRRDKLLREVIVLIALSIILGFWIGVIGTPDTILPDSIFKVRGQVVGNLLVALTIIMVTTIALLIAYIRTMQEIDRLKETI